MRRGPAAASHKSPRRPSFRCSLAGVPAWSRVPGLPGTLLSWSLHRESSQEPPGEGVASPTRFHHEPSLRVPDPEAARASPITSWGRGAHRRGTSSQEGLLRREWVRRYPSHRGATPVSERWLLSRSPPRTLP